MLPRAGSQRALNTPRCCQEPFAGRIVEGPTICRGPRPAVTPRLRASCGLTGWYSRNALRSRLITKRSYCCPAGRLPGKSRFRHDWKTLVVLLFRPVWRVLRFKVRTPQQPYGASPDHSRRQLPLGRRQCGVAVLHVSVVVRSAAGAKRMAAAGSAGHCCGRAARPAGSVALPEPRFAIGP
jgi:hypothetical protein